MQWHLPPMWRTVSVIVMESFALPSATNYSDCHFVALHVSIICGVCTATACWGALHALDGLWTSALKPGVIFQQAFASHTHTRAPCRVYNNHIFVDHADDRLGGNASLNWDYGPGYTPTGFYGAPTEHYCGPDAIDDVKPRHTWQLQNRSTQSLPDLDNPCQRLWDKYFAVNATARSWFTANHSVGFQQYMLDCNEKVVSWRNGIKQIRQVVRLVRVCHRTQKL